jgi:DNA processing protein
VSSGPRACERCLRRSFLLAGLAPAIERVLGRSPERRARSLLALDDDELVRAVGSGREHAGGTEHAGVGEMRASVASAGCWACCRHHEAYPEQLRDLAREAPVCLFGRGAQPLLSELDRKGCVTVVGSRRPSNYGREVAIRIGRELASAGMVVVSGMALGIDSCGHEGALESEGLTVAVLGAGPDAPSPARMRRLYGEIVERGLILSELPPGVTAKRWTFPARNRIMAGLGAMTVVVEARERSGSLITAELAEQLGRDVGAVPGRVGASSATGTNQLLRDGAHVVRSGQDVLDSLLGPGATRIRASAGRTGPRLEAELAAVLELVEGGAANLDSISRQGCVTASAAAIALARLELLGFVRCDSSGRYERTALAA